jgi:hypothetical protein
MLQGLRSGARMPLFGRLVNLSFSFRGMSLSTTRALDIPHAIRRAVAIVNAGQTRWL